MRQNADRDTPLQDEIVREIDERLRRLYGQSRLNNKSDPLDELIFIVLSGATPEARYTACFERLRSRFPTWQDVIAAEPDDLINAIRLGGLARKKAALILGILRELESRTGNIDLTLLRDLDDGQAEAFLLTLPGVGVKTARCVLAYSLGRPAFPVDTHVFRLATRLGWTKSPTLKLSVQRSLQECIPADLRLSLHVNFIVHGRRVCTPRNPQCHACVLADLCPTAPGRLGEDSSRGMQR